MVLPVDLPFASFQQGPIDAVDILSHIAKPHIRPVAGSLADVLKLPFLLFQTEWLTVGSKPVLYLQKVQIQFTWDSRETVSVICEISLG